MAVFTIDASVFVNAFNPYEEGHTTSQQFMRLVQDGAIPVIVPLLLLPELAAAIGRGRQDANLAQEFTRGVRELGHFTFVDIDEPLAWQSVDVAAHQRLRGSDAVYAAVARRYNTTLVTLDQEQATRMGSVVTTQSPAAAVAALTVPDEHESAGGPEHAA